MKLYSHQQKIIDDDPKKTGLFLGTGSGKTRIALLLARGLTIIICPKTQRDDGNWQREWEKIPKWRRGNTTLTVVSKEEFRRDWQQLPDCDTLIVDEAHTCLGVTPATRQRQRVTIPRASQLYEALCAYLERATPERVYLCTATVIRAPMTVWGAAQVLKPHAAPGFYDFREQYYTKLPMPGRDVWVPKNTEAAKNSLAALVRALGYVGRLEEFFDIPDQTYRTDYIELTAEQKKRIKELRLEYPDPLVRIGKVNQVENGLLKGDEFSEAEEFSNGKIDKILDYAQEFDRIVIFAKYRAQIDAIFAAVNDARLGFVVRTMTGDTKDRGVVLAEMNAATRGIFIVQAQVSAGWELPTYPAMIFASRTYSFVDYAQAQGRILRANAIKKNIFINLVVKGGVDEAVDTALRNKQDFSERVYAGI